MRENLVVAGIYSAKVSIAPYGTIIIWCGTIRMNRKNAARASSYRSAPVRIVSLRAFGFSFDEGEMAKVRYMKRSQVREDEYTGILEEDTRKRTR